MNVAAATSTVSRPFAFMTPRGSDAVETGAGTRTPTASALADPQPDAGGADPLVNRFPTIAFSFDTDASRLVMLYRDPANGKTVSQIPTEAALKQYKEAQQKEKIAERASLLKLTVGGDGNGSGQAGRQSAAYGRGGSGASPAAGTGFSAGTGISTSALSAPTAAPVALVPSATSSSVAQSSSTTTGSAGGFAARVNVVI
ncbi:hypothetical protein TSH7_09190 [Azospirillum sp. TSH7]|uniref:hypothetical protein n=1 Tax=unclassified Azospirillum TaxID=2630922 RepID=UPI000D604FD6|nr:MULTISPECIES: hypothetical protein [unclassified Azospirillum]PWC58286.1 hypothetical protein TSH20_29830 [Azospirillum sp. TSH20]PWC65050.1 hypothetical protein TSH7_09190 [Azospirillum sp. TSH7]